MTGINSCNIKNNASAINDGNLISNSLIHPAASPTPTINQKPKVRFNLDINYEKEREWNRVNKIIGDASKTQIEWTQEVEV